MIRNFLIKYERVVQRGLEIFLGAFPIVGTVIFFVGSFLFPFQLAYLVILFDVWWLYKSISLGVATSIAHRRLNKSATTNWLKKLKKLPAWRKAHHIVLILTVNEPLHLLERNLDSLVAQDLPRKQISVVLAMEARVEKQQREEKARYLRKKYTKKFSDFFVTTHRLVPGEVIGKASNENYAARWAKKQLVDRRGMDIDYITITSCDADHCFHPKHFSYLTYAFLTDSQRYLRFWQPAVAFYNNYWRLPALSRVVNTISSIWMTSILARTDRLLNCQNYSLSLKLLDSVGYWNPDIIPEDYHLFFKAFYATKGRVEALPLYLPLIADAAESTTFWKTMKNTYEQYKRWAWGVSDDPEVIKNYFLVPEIPFWDKTIRLIRLMEDHLFTPINWFFITLGITLPTLVVPSFSRTILGYTLPSVSSTILTLCLISLLFIIFVNTKRRPPRPAHVSRLRAFFIPFEFILMPITGLFFGAIPSLDAHARLMLGKRLEYRVTEKV
jgi:cellulose synthase/poly-beta-1,6-N-acetylglucosamine synthase-like glycosyltransferase